MPRVYVSLPAGTGVWVVNTNRSRTRAKADEKVQPFLAGKQIVKVIAVADKLVNIVVR